MKVWMEPTPIDATTSPAAQDQTDLQNILRLKQLFATLPDPRVIGRVLYPLPEVLLVALCAMICDCEDFTDMGHFARSQLAWLRQFIPLRHGAPSHDVFRNVFLALRRYEQREVVVLRDLSWWSKSWRWAGLQSVICVRRETMRQRHSAEKPAVEMHYYLSSSTASAAELGRLIRNHWSVENQCHHLLDVTYHEDHCQVRDKAAAHNLTLLREISTKVLKTSSVKGSIRSKRKRCALDPTFRSEATLHIFHGFGA
jgi:predicted transposase YbfD/YdcC